MGALVHKCQLSCNYIYIVLSPDLTWCLLGIYTRGESRSLGVLQTVWQLAGFALRDACK